MSQKKTRHIIQGYSADGYIITINKETMKFLWLPLSSSSKATARKEVGYGVHGANINSRQHLNRLKSNIVKRILF